MIRIMVAKKHFWESLLVRNSNLGPVPSYEARDANLAETGGRLFKEIKLEGLGPYKDTTSGLRGFKV